MSDYDKGIDEGIRATSIAWFGSNEATLGRFLAAFLAEQHEVWWCGEHKTIGGPNGCLRGSGPSWPSESCRLVKACIVVGPE